MAEDSIELLERGIAGDTEHREQTILDEECRGGSANDQVAPPATDSQFDMTENAKVIEENLIVPIPDNSGVVLAAVAVTDQADVMAREAPTPPAKPQSTPNVVSAAHATGRGLKTRMLGYFRKWGGVTWSKAVPRPSGEEMFWSFLGAVSGLLILCGLQYRFLNLDHPDLVILIGSFGATAVLVYGLPTAPLSQPRNVLGGHIFSALVGVIFREFLVDETNWSSGLFLIASLAVATSIVVMQVCRWRTRRGGAEEEEEDGGEERGGGGSCVSVQGVQLMMPFPPDS